MTDRSVRIIREIDPWLLGEDTPEYVPYLGPVMRESIRPDLPSRHFVDPPSDEPVQFQCVEFHISDCGRFYAYPEILDLVNRHVRDGYVKT